MSIEAYPSPNGVLTSLIWRKTMSGGETSLSGYDNASQALSYTPGQEQVYLNGILLVRGDDYTATNGTSITGLSALAASDFIQVNCYNNFSVATTPATSITGTIANNQLANSAITINGSAISLGGSVTLAGDIESVTAGTGLTGGGSSGAVTLGLSTPVATTNGGTGLSTFTTGDLVYASGSDTLAKRSIGTTGQVLTVSGGVPTWATASSGGMTLLSTTSLSGATTTISSISQDYKELFIYVYGVTNATANGALQVAPNNATTSNVRAEVYYVSSPESTATNGASGGKINFSAGQNIDRTSPNNAWVLRLPNYASTESMKPYQISGGFLGVGGGYNGFTAGGIYYSTTAISSLVFNNSGGNLSTGTVLVYGVK